MTYERTSESHPLQIAVLAVPGASGELGVTFAPGKQDLDAMSGRWRRDLGRDLKAIARWGASLVVTLLEEREMNDLQIRDLGVEVGRAGIEWLHMPIQDVSTPGKEFEARWPAESARIRVILAAGGKVLVHCKGGLGRAGMVAARILVEMGEAPDAAIEAVRDARSPKAIETHAQEDWVQAGVRAREGRRR